MNTVAFPFDHDDANMTDRNDHSPTATYTEVAFTIEPVTPWREILAVELAGIGFDSFEESFTDPTGMNGELKAYIPADRFDPAAMERLLTLRDPHVAVTWTAHEIPPANWNAAWESSFRPVEVGGEVRIRADFHQSVPGFEHEIVITPRMAFGTGHHATTRMMIQAMLGMRFAGLDVCDMGCGTGVLAILAARMGAGSIRAVDIDAHVVDNARENAERNGCPGIVVDIGIIEDLGRAEHDVILANIERNVLLEGMERMYDALRPGGALLLSGFVVSDRHIMAQRAKETGFTLAERMSEEDGELDGRNGWALLGCRKNT